MCVRALLCFARSGCALDRIEIDGTIKFLSNGSLNVVVVPLEVCFMEAPRLVDVLVASCRAYNRSSPGAL